MFQVIIKLYRSYIKLTYIRTVIRHAFALYEISGRLSSSYCHSGFQLVAQIFKIVGDPLVQACTSLDRSEQKLAITT